MAWRPQDYLIDGCIDCRKNGKVTGWLRFHSFGKVTLNLNGFVYPDVQGKQIKINRFIPLCPPTADDAKEYLQGFSRKQTGTIGDITAGRKPVHLCYLCYTDHPYIEWFNKTNGRVVLELNKEDVRVCK